MANDTSLVILLKCSMCQTTVDSLKLLPCRHKLCLSCTSSLPIVNTTYNCPACDNVHPVPNGGFNYLPYSLLTREIVEVANLDRPTAGVSLSQLKEKMNDEVKSGQRWRDKAKKMMENETNLKESVMKGYKTALKAIKDHNDIISLKCDEKLGALNDRLEERTSQLTESSRRNGYSLESDSEGIVESVRLSYQLPEDMEGFIRGNVTHSSVGLLVRIDNGKPLAMFPEKNYWVGSSLTSLVKSPVKAEMPFIGDTVRIKSSVQKPKFGESRPMVKKSRGVFREIDYEASITKNDLVVIIEFPEVKEWRGLYSEVAMAPALRKTAAANLSRTSPIAPAEECKASLQAQASEVERAIKEFKGQMKMRCIAKFDEEKTAAAKSEADIGEHLDMIKSYDEAMKGAMEGVAVVLEKLSNDIEITPSLLLEAENKLVSLQVINVEVRSVRYGVESADEWNFGDSMKILRYDEESMELGPFVDGETTIGSIGIFLGQKSEEVQDSLIPSKTKTKKSDTVMFANGSHWEGPSKLCYKMPTNTRAPYIGDKVQMKHEYWERTLGDVRMHRVGSLMAVDITDNQAIATVEFTKEISQTLPYSAIELVPGCGFGVGDRVTINKHVKEPSRGDGGVTRSSVGQVVGISGAEGNEEISVDFPECKGWVGVSKDLQRVRKLKERDEVQVKLTVTAPRNGWRSINHTDIGFLHTIYADGTCEVAWYEKDEKKWSCLVDEIELARYRIPSYDSNRVGGSHVQQHFIPPGQLADFLKSM